MFRILSYGGKISHCKFTYSPNKSTLSDANNRRNYGVFEAIYYNSIKEYLPSLSDSQKQLVIDRKTYSIDSTIISLFQPIFECVGHNPSSGKRKGGIKSHQKLDMQARIPTKVYHSNAKEHDSLFIQHEGVANKGELLLFDKAYNNYQLFDKWTANDVRFVTRLKNSYTNLLLESPIYVVYLHMTLIKILKIKESLSELQKIKKEQNNFQQVKRLI